MSDAEATFQIKKKIMWCFRLSPKNSVQTTLEQKRIKREREKKKTLQEMRFTGRCEIYMDIKGK